MGSQVNRKICFAVEVRWSLKAPMEYEKNSCRRILLVSSLHRTGSAHVNRVTTTLQPLISTSGVFFREKKLFVCKWALVVTKLVAGGLFVVTTRSRELIRCNRTRSREHIRCNNS